MTDIDTLDRRLFVPADYLDLSTRMQSAVRPGMVLGDILFDARLTTDRLLNRRTRMRGFGCKAGAELITKLAAFGLRPGSGLEYATARQWQAAKDCVLPRITRAEAEGMKQVHGFAPDFPVRIKPRQRAARPSPLNLAARALLLQEIDRLNEPCLRRLAAEIPTGIIDLSVELTIGEVARVWQLVAEAPEALLVVRPGQPPGIIVPYNKPNYYKAQARTGPNDPDHLLGDTPCHITKYVKGYKPVLFSIDPVFIAKIKAPDRPAQTTASHMALNN